MAPYRFETTADAAGLRETWGHLEPGVETGQAVKIAGRVLLLRDAGKLAFATLADGSGDGTATVQLFAPAAVTDDHAGFTKLHLGDWIGVEGEVMTTRKGELSVKVERWTMLAEARRPFPKGHFGLADPDTRYRQRYVDLWVTDDAARTFRLRIAMLRELRRFLEDRGFSEVETPTFHPIAGGATAQPFVTHHNALDVDLYLRIAPELYLKRLIVGGLTKVFEVARVFRNEGLSPRHQPEFTMLELYQAYADYHDMMRLMEELVAHLALVLRGTTQLTYGGRDLDLTPPWRRATMTELIEETIGEAVDLRMDPAKLRRLCVEHDVELKDGWGPGKQLLELYEKTTESTLWGPVFVCDYPKEVSPLARDHRELAGMTERFEPIVAGRELGNAFSELTDPDDQRARFQDQVRLEEEGAVGVDEDYIRALEYGLPPTGGLGLGIDRLVMLLADVPTIRDVILFPTLKPEAKP